MDRFQTAGIRHTATIASALSHRVILGRNVNRLRQQRGLTQEKLAEMTNIDRRHIQRIERGSANPGIDVLQTLKSALNASWSELLDSP